MNKSESKKGKKIALVAVFVMLIFVFAFGGYSFAKYTTKGTGSDEARVAQWGINVTKGTNDSGFSAKYTADAENKTLAAAANGAAFAASAANGSDIIVAPGAAGSMTLVISGTAEVAVGVKMAIEVENDIGISSENYYPIEFTLTDLNGAEVASGTLSEVSAALAAETDYINKFAPNHSFATKNTYTLSWSWAFFVDAATDALDTQIAIAADTDADVSKTISFTWSVTVDQLAENIAVA
ncbi:MAG: hypothetical protein DBX59_08615 [Bacillota bacterium]|nr:MAG: hypothetical protein DBX59_08615 [Bacillota bacterium]